MSKVSGTYPSLSRGVSQQSFEARLDGQHGEQVNMWTDPVHGLTRRRGTQLMHCSTDNVFGPSYFTLDADKQQELRAFYASYRTIPYTAQGKDMLVHYPTAPTPTWMRDIFVGGQGGIRVTRKIGSPIGDSRAESVPVSMGVYQEPEYTATSSVVWRGFSSAVQVGRYMLLMPNDTKFTVPPETDGWASAANSHWVVEVKQGIPNRQYTLAFDVDGVTYSYSYTTPSSAYGGTLSTNDIPADDPEYQKKVNDRVNAYNSAVTAWITEAAQKTRPQYIVDQWMEAGAATHLTAVGSLVNGGSAHMIPNVFVVRNTNGRTANPAANDAGDGSSVAVTGSTVASLANLTRVHVYGKVVKVQPERGQESFFVKAVRTEGKDTWGRVRWEECPKTTQAPISNPMTALAVKSDEPPEYTPTVGIARATPSGLAYLGSSAILDDPSVQQLPLFNGRLVGDQDSSPPPSFFGRQVSWMGMFQDRLCIASGSTIDMSEVGNYFNFFRTQTLTVPDKDPVSIFALGSETDTIRHSVIFDRSLLLFGDNQQYMIDGRNPVTPSTSSIIQSSSIEDAVDCPPVTGGSMVFFGKRRESSSEIFQMEVGDVADTSNFTGLGLQLSDYLPGKPAQLLYVASPSTLFVRTSEAPHSVFVFRFIDQNRQRILDSWSRFDYHPAFGIIYGMFYHEDALYYRVARESWVDENGHEWTGGRGDHGFDAIERQSLLPQVAGLPYLDSMRPARSVWDGGAYGVDFWATRYPFMSTAFARGPVEEIVGGPKPPLKNAYWLHGVTPVVNSQAVFDSEFSDIPTGAAKRDVAYAVSGISFDAFVELTSPVRRDNNGNPMMQGRLTVSKLDVSFRDSAGLSAAVNTRGGLTAKYKFNGRVLGQAANMVGVIPITTGNTSVFIGRDSKDYVCRIGSRSWMPLSITRVSWTGQWFMNHRFV